MDSTTTRTLLEVTAALLALAAAASALGLRLQKAQKRVAGRIANVTDGYLRVAAPTEAHRSARRQTDSSPPLHRLALLFGYDYSRADHYRVKWWIVAPMCLVVARLAAQLIIPLVGWIALVAVPPAAFLMCRSFYKWCTGRRRQSLYVQFPDALAMIVRGVRVGVPVAESMRVVAREAHDPTASEFRRVADRVALGAPTEEALYEMAERNEVAEYRFFATAIGLQAQTGGALSETLDNLADVIRKRVAMRARGLALASEARTSIIILCALPVVTGFGMFLLNPDYFFKLFDNELGKKVFGSAVISLSIGVAVMQWIVKKSLS